MPARKISTAKHDTTVLNRGPIESPPITTEGSIARQSLFAFGTSANNATAKRLKSSQQRVLGATASPPFPLGGSTPQHPDRVEGLGRGFSPPIGCPVTTRTIDLRLIRIHLPTVRCVCTSSSSGSGAFSTPLVTSVSKAWPSSSNSSTLSSLTSSVADIPHIPDCPAADSPSPFFAGRVAALNSAGAERRSLASRRNLATYCFLFRACPLRGVTFFFENGPARSGCLFSGNGLFLGRRLLLRDRVFPRCWFLFCHEYEYPLVKSSVAGALVDFSSNGSRRSRSLVLTGFRAYRQTSLNIHSTI